ncbi:MAG TPA: methylated-DNA--[protein]-cysteine S-methyltransferase [Thermoanaerobacterales bacterium]|nr:methylated-DNA--[protein]-cysteine S-methyltransferase [Thermoanaerobacterales bacterium]
MDIYKKPQLGDIYISSNINGLCRVKIGSSTEKEEKWLKDNFGKVKIHFDMGKNHIYITQLDEYFNGSRTKFDLPMNLVGTEFQKSVWNVLKDIPYGKTLSYKEVAIKVGKPKAARAIGQANNRNPISIIIPCHRVIGADGSLTGYGGGMDAKRYLLELESKYLKDAKS